MGTKAVALYAALMLLFTGGIMRIYMLSSGQWLAQASAEQSAYLLKVGASRGMIYDREMRPVVSLQEETVAAVAPSPQAMAALLEQAQKNPDLSFDKQAMRPFTLKLKEPVYAKNIEHFQVPKRYGSYSIAPHLIGYLSPEGDRGIAGIELAYDDILQQYSGSLSVRYEKTGNGTPFPETPAQILADNYKSNGGIVLTLDKYVQLVAQDALKDVEKGAVVVMDVHSGALIACASQPAFDPTDLAASLRDKNAPFVNRAFAPYSVGSVFKLVTAAAALENGFGRFTPYDCKGYTDVEDVRFHCHYRDGHGTLDMKRAIAVSCNPYFIELAAQTGGTRITSLARAMGFDRMYAFTSELRSQSGNLPSAEELDNPAAVGNLGFGQGSLTATPLQVAQMISVIANGGYTVSPKLVEGITSDGRSVDEYTQGFAQNQILSPDTAKHLQEYLIYNVTDGSGALAAPRTGGAGGKTASAQTGIFVTDEKGQRSEIVHAWFAGFYPAQNPRYAIVALVENGQSGSDTAAPIFARVANALA